MTDVVIRVEGAETVRPVEIALGAIQPATSPTRISLEADGNIPAASFVNFFSDSGTVKQRLADSTDATKPAHGYVENAITDGNSGPAILGRGLVISGLSGLTPGIDQWLGTDGGPTEVVPSADGALVQYLGFAITATSMLYVHERGVTL